MVTFVKRRSMIRKNFPLKTLNSFGLDLFSNSFLEVESEKEIEALIKSDSLKEFGDDILVLGGGSNILFTENYRGIIIRPAIKDIIFNETENNQVLIKAGAGVNWDEFVNITVEAGLSGLENLSLIPGTVGAAPIQNIGAYGVEVASVIKRVNFIHIDSGTKESLSGAECNFGYRDSIFKNSLKNRTIIISVEFLLSRDFSPILDYGDIKAVLGTEGSPTPSAVREAVIEIRRSKLPDPAVKGNAGSFFRNPVVTKDKYLALKSKYPEMPGYPSADGNYKIPAGWMIEKSGWKGKRKGNAGVHDKQALVLVNHGGATGKEIHDLSIAIKKDVYSMFRVTLETEVNII